jgi:hypothetical protein
MRCAAGVSPALAAAAVILLSSGGLAEAARSAPVTLRTAQGSSSALSSGLLDAVSAVPGTSHAYAVGNHAGFMACYGGYVLNYNGGSWKRVRSGLSADVALNGVAAVSAKKIWIVGGTYPQKSCLAPSRPFLASSSGGRFKAYSLKRLNLGDAALDGISAPSAADVWIIGHAVSKSTRSPIVLHFNGASWKHVSIPSKLAKNQVFSSVGASGPKNVWIVATNGSTGASELLHWNGTWTSYPAAENVYLQSVATSSADRAWVVGGAYSARWNGKTWTKVIVPKSISLLFGVSMSGTSAWAVGEEFVGNESRTVPTALQSTGRRWRLEAVPDPSESKSQVNQSALTAVSAASGRFVAAVGQNGIQCGTGNDSFADVYTGGRWKTADGLARGVTGIAAVPDCGG